MDTMRLHTPSPVMFGSLIGLALVTGYLLGRLLTEVQVPVPPTVLRPDTRPPVSVVRLGGVEEGSLRGIMTGAVRFFVGEREVLPELSGAFRYPIGSFFTNTVPVNVPVGMHFVASKKGKYFYPVDASDGERIVPANRLYFPDAESAVARGYRRPL